MTRRSGVGPLLVAAAALAGAIGVTAAERKPDFAIAPGPATISEEEKAIAADPNMGVEQGVILVRETERDESGGIDHAGVHLAGLDRVTFHFRAKILGSEARSLGDIEIPIESRVGYLKDWWGRTLLPDGTVLELKREDLREQVVASYKREQSRLLKGILPGITPGCVIDVGWTVLDTTRSSLRSLPMQGPWPVRLFRYHWIPPASGSAWTITRREGLKIEMSREKMALAVTGKDLPAVIEEPLMPPGDEARATLWLYRTRVFNTGTKDFWDTLARGVEDNLTTFMSYRPSITRAIDAMKLPDGADLMSRLRLAYDWLTLNVKDVDLLTSEEEEAMADQKESKRRLAGDVIDSGAGDDEEIADLYVAIARRLGAEANLVFAVDRTDHYWHPDLLTMAQFDATLVAVRIPGDPDEKAVYVDPGSGLAFGEIPWWLTGVNGLLVGPKGARSVTIWDAPARRNVADTRVDISFGASGDASVHWTRKSTGQQGYAEKVALRRMSPADRRKELDELCGGDSGMEVAVSEMPSIEDVRAGSMMHCEGEIAAAGPADGMSEFSFTFDGVWIGKVPELSSASRVHPVVLNYPAITLVTMDVVSPPGFVPKEAPSPVTIESSEGSYTLAIEKIPAGYRVRRDFALLPLAVKPEDYPVLRRYLEDVRRADRTPLVFVRSGAPPS